MRWFYGLLGVLAAAIFLTIPAGPGPAAGYLAVLAWTAYLLYAIFEREDPVSNAAEGLRSAQWRDGSEGNRA